MLAIRCIQKVENHAVIVKLPPDFDFDQVEVIVFPVGGNHDLSGSDKFIAEPISNELPTPVQEFMKLDTSAFTSEQRAAHTRAVLYLQTQHAPDFPRVFGLLKGLIETSDDFDQPLPPEIEGLFWGSETDNLGINLS